jgi:hypothetical protein
MGGVHTPNGGRENQIGSLSSRAHVKNLDVDALVEENKQLRELVVRLSEIVIRKVLDQR